MNNKFKELAVREIKEALGTSALEEAYIVQTKKFDLKTDLLSEKTKAADIENVEAATETLNVVSSKLDTAERIDLTNYYSDFRALKLAETYNLNESFLSAYYLDNISALNSKISMDSLAYMRLARDFGTFDAWQKDFIACAQSSRNGYAMTIFSCFLQRYMNVVIDSADLHVPMNAVPIIVLKMSESAYFKDYLNDKKSYIFAMMKELDWELIETRIKKSDKIGKILS